MAELRLGEEAAQEYADALAFYAARSSSAADGFEAAFADVVEMICRFPEMFPGCDEEGYRFARLNRYPYSLIYRLAGDVALVVAVAHASRRPGYWAGR